MLLLLARLAFRNQMLQRPGESLEQGSCTLDRKSGQEIHSKLDIENYIGPGGIHLGGMRELADVILRPLLITSE